MTTNKDRVGTFKPTRAEVRRLVGFARLLASYGCAGAPACEQPAVDVATGRRDGELCGPCDAEDWLIERGLMR